MSTTPPASVHSAALIVAGGRGTRAQTKTPKQYMPLGGLPLLRRTVAAFAAHPRIDAIQIVIGEGDEERFRDAVAGLDKLLPPAFGGSSRQASVQAGLKALAKLNPAPTTVLIHDGARPFVSEGTISAVIDALNMAEGAIAAQPVADTLKRENSAGGIEDTVSRDKLWRAQTPQGFRFDTILNAHQEAPADQATDDAALLEAKGIHVTLVPDDPRNMKLTYKEDFALAEQLLGPQVEHRTGLGVDVHAFEEGGAVILGGVSIPHTHKLKGHSDADVALHAITDALYGAIGDGDIGTHFPPSDPQWKGTASHIFAGHAAERVRDRGGRITMVDLTVMCEAPKISPHREAIRAEIARILDISADRVSVKATTTEQLGFTGRREGIMAQAIATVTLPSAPA